MVKHPFPINGGYKMENVFQIADDLFVRIDKGIIVIAQDDWKKSGNYSQLFITKEQLKQILELSENGGK